MMYFGMDYGTISEPFTPTPQFTRRLFADKRTAT